MPIFNGFLPLKGHLEFSGAFFLAEILKKVSLDPHNFLITRLSAKKSEQMKNFQGIKICLYLPFKYKIRLTKLWLSGLEVFSRWVPLLTCFQVKFFQVNVANQKRKFYMLESESMSDLSILMKLSFEFFLDLFFKVFKGAN